MAQVTTARPFVESVTGLEYSKGMFEQAREKTEKLGNVKLQQGDITDMPFPDKHFAGITINQVLFHPYIPVLWLVQMQQCDSLTEKSQLKEVWNLEVLHKSSYTWVY